MANLIVKQFLLIGFASLCLLDLTGCAGPFARFLRDMPEADYLHEEYAAGRPTTVAVLPLENETTDMDAPGMIRRLMNSNLLKNGYDTLRSKTITTTLREEGINYAGQLNSITVEELGQLLAADALLYGRVIEFKHFISGIYNQRAVATHFELVNIDNGELLWRDDYAIQRSEFMLDPVEVGEALISHLTRRVVEKATGRALLEESGELVAGHLSTLPWGPGKRGYPSWLWTNPRLKGGFSMAYGYPNLFGAQFNFWRQRLGAQLNLSFGSQTMDLLYAFKTNGPKKAYAGIKLGNYLDFADPSDERKSSLSILVGIEALRWRYGRLIHNASLSISVGYTLGDCPGPLLIMNRGFYFN